MAYGIKRGAKGQRINSKNQLQSIRKWPGWDEFTLCDNCGKTRDEVRIYHARVSRVQWEWMGGIQNQTKQATGDTTPCNYSADICEVCWAYLKERGPQNGKERIW